MKFWIAAAFAFAALGVISELVPIAENEVLILAHNQDCHDSPKIKLGDWALIHFIASVDERSETGVKGEILHNSYDQGVPSSIHLVGEEIFAGWLKGLVDIACKGSKITMVVPPEMAFQDGMIHKFEMEILEVSSEEIPVPSMFAIVDANEDGKITRDEFVTYFLTRRQRELKGGEPPMVLFTQDDLNENQEVNWEEFSGPKGTAPPSAAQAILDVENANPELTAIRERNLKKRLEESNEEEHGMDQEEDLLKDDEESVDEL